jgi:hypothetical protein
VSLLVPASDGVGTEEGADLVAVRRWDEGITGHPARAVSRAEVGPPTGRLVRRAPMALLGAAAGLLCVACVAAAGATTATATITAGPLGLASTAPRLTATTDLGGRTETTGTQQLDVSDATGSGARWAVTVAPAHGSMPPMTAAVVAARATCPAPSSCGPVTFVAAAPSVPHPRAEQERAITVLATTSEGGQGDELVVLTWRLTSGTAVGTPTTSGWVLSLVTGP